MYKYLFHSQQKYNDIYKVDQKDQEHVTIANKLINECRHDPSQTAHYITRRNAEQMTAKNRKLYQTGQATVNNPAGATEIIDIQLMIDDYNY